MPGKVLLMSDKSNNLGVGWREGTLRRSEQHE